ncbi:MAG: hypothetical protein IJ266_01835, partial [Elusimicrobiaceae bacterium]|nr:hypothetical protein [Elusimicrobiaceae bacterium]
SQPIDTKPHILDLGYLEKGDKVSVFAPIKEGQSGYTYLYAVTVNDKDFKEEVRKKLFVDLDQGIEEIK